MPELPEVETVRRGLEQHTLGCEWIRIEIVRARVVASPPDPELFSLALRGTRVQAWQRRGKYLLASLAHADGSAAGHWGVHLRMTGQFLWLDVPTAVCRHTRARFWCDDGQELRFVDTRSFGQMWWVPAGLSPETVIGGLTRLGPEPFAIDFDVAYLQRSLEHSKRSIKTALLDQSLVAGVGNIYADESLFAAGIRPQTPANQLDPLRLGRLREALLEVLESSIRAGGTTFSDFRHVSGLNGTYGGQSWVYRRSGQPCKRCGETIRVDRLGGRSSHWCPRCQS
ncbi:MAG: DNA-formamidopyrimidine glycosylase [Cyanobacteriota bacterium]|nr:DNA-formamidopyrimidine glycosylase [Cyanobacteriota bacterium]